jgi:tetratricopeptide (TPR) repeat protein
MSLVTGSPARLSRFAPLLLGLSCIAAGPEGRASLTVPLSQLGDISLDQEQSRLTELLEKSGGDPYILEQLARLAYTRGNVPLATQLWDQAARQEPRIASAKVQLVFAELAAGNLEGARRRLEPLDVESAADPHVLLAAGELAVMSGEAEAANAHLMRALDLAPHYAVTHLTLGHFMEVTGQLETARTSYEKAAELQPEHSQGWLRLAALHLREGAEERALSAFRKAEECTGIQPLAETRMGEAYYLRGDLFNAFAYFQRAAERNQEDAFPKLRIAQVKYRAGRVSEALSDIRAILQNAEYPEALRVAAEYELQAGRLDNALSYYLRRLKAVPEDWIAANNTALLLVQTEGSADDAAGWIDRAIELAPQSSPALMGTKGCVLWYAGRASEAEPLLKQAVEALPNNPWTRYCYGKTLVERRRFAAARRQFAACQFLDPHFPRREEVERILAQPPLQPTAGAAVRAAPAGRVR